MGVHHAAGNFQFYRVRAVAVLLNHHEILVRRDGNNVHPIDAINDDKLMLLVCAR